MVILKRIEDKIQVDTMGTAGGSGIFNLSWGTESSFVKQFSKRVKEYCAKHDITFEDIVADEGVRKY